MKYLILEDESVITFADDVQFSSIRSQQKQRAVSYGRISEEGKTLFISPAYSARFEADKNALHLRFPLHTYKIRGVYKSLAQVK